MIVAYKGKSVLSKMIRFVTWSEYSHISWVDNDGWEVEAWKGGVRQVDTPHVNHKPDTEMDLFMVELDECQLTNIRWFLKQQVGKKYDYLGNLHFLTRRKEYKFSQEKWFCSELVFAAFEYAGVKLLKRVPAYKVSPGLLVCSPLLTRAATSTTPDTKERGSKTLEKAPDGQTCVKTPKKAYGNFADHCLSFAERLRNGTRSLLTVNHE